MFLNIMSLPILATLGSMLSAFSAAPDQTRSPMKPQRLYGSLQMAPSHFAIGRKAGLRVAVIAVSWERFEPMPNLYDENYVKSLVSEKQRLRKLGYKLQIDLGVQYPPKWVYALPHGRYRDQFGDIFVSREPGEDLPNVVFNAGVRTYVATYIGKVFSKLGDDWDFVRLGCGKFGELNYPQYRFEVHENCYWAFDDLAQGKVSGMPRGLVPCPVPGWIPGASSPDHAAARSFIDWYLNCLKNYQEWQIATVRHWYTGELCMLYGSWGLRPGWLEKAIRGDLDGSSSCERNGELQQGCDWARMIDSIKDPRVIVYCTWVDGTIGNRDITDDDSADPSRWSPVHWQASLAQANSPTLRVWGENTGHNNRETMRLTFKRIKRFNLMGLMWAFDSELFCEPRPEGGATLDDFSEFIKADARR